MLATPTSAAVPAGFGFPELKPLPELAPGPWTLTRAAVDAWAAKAKPGDELVYARAAYGPKGDGVDALQELHDAGGVTFKQRRIGPEDIAYIARRLKGDVKPSERQKLALRGARTAETEEELVLLLAELRKAANRNEPCPTNRELSAAIESTGPDRIAYLLGILIRERKITVEALAKGLRLVTILSTGKQTAKVFK